MVNVLHVVSYFPPDRVGGVGEVVANVHRALLRAGQESTVLTTGRSSDDPRVLRVARSPAGFVLGSARGLGLARRADIVHLHHGEAALLPVLLQVLSPATPVLLTLHVSVPALRRSLAPYEVGGQRLGRGGLSGQIERHLVLPLRVLLDRIVLGVADRVTFIARSTAADLLPPEQRAVALVIHNGIPISDPKAGAGASDAPSPVDLLFVGTNSVRKRVELLPLVLAAVRAQRPGARLRIVGFSADENPALTALARELGVLSAIDFSGRMRADELAPFYRTARVLLVPSAYEGLPMVILEAFAQGLPCVATNVSGHPEVIADGRNGFLVPLDDPQAMADAALRILDAPDLQAQFSAAARNTVREHFDLQRQLRDYLALYDEMCGQKPVAPARPVPHS